MTTPTPTPTPPTPTPEGTGSTGDTAPVEVPALTFERDVGGWGFTARTPLPAAFAVDHGALAPAADGLSAHVDPDRSGRLRVTAVLADGTALERTALVMDTVAEPWDQPEPLDGLVSTRGWEDSVQVSADGAWLLFEYLPIPIDCLFGLDPTSPLCTEVRGPVGPPERPDFPGADRVQNGVLANGCPSIGLPPEFPWPTPPAALYALRRMPDGSYAEPHALVWAGADGCFSSFGPSLFSVDGDHATLLYAFDSPLDTLAAQLFVDEVDLGAGHTFGTFTWEGGVLGLVGRTDAPIGPVGEVGGNPHAWRAADGSLALFFDDEEGRADLLASTAPDLAGPWTPTVTLPISLPPQESQPFYDGDQLLFRRDLTVFASTWTGGPLEDPASLSTPEVVLDGDFSATGVGEVLGAGEPSVAHVDGGRELFFVVVQRAEDGTLDLDLARVAERR